MLGQIYQEYPLLSIYDKDIQDYVDMKYHGLIKSESIYY